MTGTPDFTVIIPAYNYGRFVSRAIDSALSQSGPTCEVLVIDDGSTDDTASVLASYGDRIVAVSQRNQGVAAARNTGLDRARGRMIVCLDADDRLLPGALLAFASAFEQHPSVGMIVGRHRSLDESGTIVGTSAAPRFVSGREHNFRRYLGRKLSLCNGRAAIRRAALTEIRYPVGVTHGEDLVVFGLVLATVDGIGIPNVVCEILDHPQRARRHYDRMLRNGTAAVAALFESAVLPETLRRHRPLFESAWLLDLGRAALRIGDHQQARECYRRAIACDWRVAFRVRHMGRLLRTFLPPTSISNSRAA